jgi:(p)ppGpp synthase/HD superfamily hydrolase
MIYATAMIKTAMRIAFDAHKDQVDRTGLPYIYHPVRMVGEPTMNTEIELCAALLHDVLDNRDLTFGNLYSAGISDEVIDVLKLLANDDSVPYWDYITAIRDSENATAIQ